MVVIFSGHFAHNINIVYFEALNVDYNWNYNSVNSYFLSRLINPFWIAFVTRRFHLNNLNNRLSDTSEYTSPCYVDNVYIGSS